MELIRFQPEDTVLLDRTIEEQTIPRKSNPPFFIFFLTIWYSLEEYSKNAAAVLQRKSARPYEQRLNLHKILTGLCLEF